MEEGRSDRLPKHDQRDFLGENEKKKVFRFSPMIHAFRFTDKQLHGHVRLVAVHGILEVLRNDTHDTRVISIHHSRWSCWCQVALVAQRMKQKLSCQ